MSVPPKTATSPEPQPALQIHSDVSLRDFNTFGLPAMARHLVRIVQESDVRAVLAHREWGRATKFVLGGGSNVVFTQDVEALVLKMEVPGIQLIETRGDAYIVEAGAGVLWHDLVQWTQDQNIGGLENLALIPGTVGAAPVQNIGAYGVELQDRFESLVTVDLVTGRSVVLDAARCQFGYRDSVFKHPAASGGLEGKSVITRVRLRLPRPWQPMLEYLDLQRKMAEAGMTEPDARQIFDWV